MRGFNVGVTVSLGDMELALDYVNNPDLFMPDIKEIVESKNRAANIVEDSPTYEDYIQSRYYEDLDGSDESDDIVIDMESDEYYMQDDEELEENTRDNLVGHTDVEDKPVEEAPAGRGILLEQSNEEDSSTVVKPVYGETTGKVISIDTKTRGKSPGKSLRELELEKEILEAKIKLEKLTRGITGDGGQVKELNVARNTSTKEVEQVDKSKRVAKKRTVKASEKLGVGGKGSEDGNDIQIRADRIKEYSYMDVDALYDRVKIFLDSQGVKKNIINRGLLDTEFGKDNIQKLIKKSYLILIGKGVTMGK